ncbi:hypothetical protein ACFU53_03045 [Streptomyces sp. NPDC057474]|uniref:hypothetical protein n=1 Tax=Streptomyces sp. NPDC057474 TaxID=3346144 RepID=UPI00367E9118
MDTANRLQGHEFDITLVWHPLSGRQVASAFHLETGRLCVLLSRRSFAGIVVARAGITDLLDRHSRSSPVYLDVPPKPERWCGITKDEQETSPWSSGPLIGNASSPVIHFGKSWNMAEEASAYAADLANSMGLVCFDVQQNRLRL